MKIWNLLQNSDMKVLTLLYSSAIKIKTEDQKSIIGKFAMKYDGK